MRCRGAAALAAALLLALSASTHAAVVAPATPVTPPQLRYDGPEGPGVIYAPTDAYAQLVRQLTAGLAVTADAFLKDQELPDDGVVIASAPPANVTVDQVKQALGTIMAAVSAEASARSSLGDPAVFPYNDGTGRVALYRFPRRRARGTCIFVHGCKHDPHSWFYKSKKCPRCTGLPEEVSHSKQCLARGYAVLALMSLDRRYRFRCFSSSGGPGSNDHPSARDLVTNWMNTFNMMGKAKFIFGVSSGASFAVKFPMTMWMDGVVSEVNMPWEKAWGATDGRGNLKVRFPPTAFYMMQRDDQTRRQIEQATYILNRNGVPAEYVYVPARPVHRTWLAQRSVYINKQQSAQIWQALVKARVIDRRGNVLYDVRTNRKWVNQLLKAVPWLKQNDPFYNLVSDESQIWQELNLAWAWHEIVSDYVRATLAWLENPRRSNLNALVRKYNVRDNIACLTEKREGCRGRG